MAPTPDEVRRQLERLLTSAVFASSGRLRRFLEFVVERTLAGEGDRLKEYVIGVEVFDRDAHYDPRLDSIVRVEAARLRTKLTEYYHGAGRADPIVLTLPKGGYAPVATRVEPTSAAVLPAARDEAPALAPAVAAEPTVAPARGRWRYAWPLGGAAALAIVAAVGLGARWNAVDDPKLRIAVLPFMPYSGEAEAQALAMRLTDGVTAELVRTGRFAVVASTTAREVAATPGRARDLAAALDADVLIQANLATDGDGVRVEARAVGGKLEQKFWVENFRSDAAQLDALEREIAAAVANLRFDDAQSLRASAPQ